MKKTTGLTPRACIAAAFFLGAAVTARAADVVPVEAFYEKPAISEARISPTGRHIALIAANKEDRNQLVVLDTATLRPFVAAAAKDRDVGRIQWVNEKRLVYSVSDRFVEGESRYGLGSLFAVDLDGQEHRAVVATTGFGGAAAALNGYTPQFHATTWLQDSDKVFVEYPVADSHRDIDYSQLKLVDTRTGRAEQLEGPPKPTEWFTGPGDTPRVVMTREEGFNAGVYYKDPATRQWVKLRTVNQTAYDSGFGVVGYGDDDTLYVTHQMTESGYTGLYSFNLKTRKFSDEPILSAKGFDVHPVMLRSRDRIIGARFETDAMTTVWFDPEWKKVQAKVDALLPSTINVVSVPVRAETPYVLVIGFSDVNPGRAYLYDTKAEKLVELGAFRPRVDPSRMGHRDFVRVKARDGLEVPAWITVPKDGKKEPHPMVVLVHGGPYVRGGHWGWNPDAEFLASRGYVVLEPEYRGSTGFGYSHFKAGWKQWGLKMQDDVADATRYAIQKGIADPKRICIAGASYGGYATLMGLINDPDLYKCGFEWVGVTDIDLMYSISWSDFDDTFRQFGMPVLVADREKDAAQIKATSPVNLAAKIKQPLLLGYGGEDVRVPLKHGTEFRDAVSKTNSSVEWVVYPDAGHGWHQLKDNVDWWTRVEKFLAKNIGEGAK